MSNLTLVEAPPVAVEGDFSTFETDEERALTTNIYAEIRRRLALRGVPPEQVAFIHDAKTSEARAALFQAANAGKIRVLIGSTEKMGTGMNAQERLVAIHQITPPWRPGDIEQQVGRMLRQGNRYPEVFQFIYVTEGSFDGYVWQLLENKAGFIDQIARGAVTAREVDDVAENVLTFSEIKALASGNPKIMQKVVLDSELARLGAIHSAWRSAQLHAAWQLEALRSRKSEQEKILAAYEEAICRRDANTPGKFKIMLNRSTCTDDLEVFTDREAAGKCIRSLAAGCAIRMLSERKASLSIGQFKGFELTASTVRSLPTGELVPQVYFQVGSRLMMVNIGETDAGILMSLDAKLRSLESEAEHLRQDIRVAIGKIQSLEDELHRPWEHEGRYAAIKSQVDDLARELDASGAKSSVIVEVALEETRSDDTTTQVQAALAVIEALHTNPGLLERFGMETEEPALEISPEGLKKLEEEIQEKQTLLAFGQAILQSLPQGEAFQLTFFGEVVPVANVIRRGKRCR